MSENTEKDYRKPDAYDAEGRALYYMEDKDKAAEDNHRAAPSQKLTPAEQADHARSVHDYPELDLSEDEYVVTDLERNPIAYVFIWVVAALIAVLMIGGVFLLVSETSSEPCVGIACVHQGVTPAGIPDTPGINPDLLYVIGFAMAALALIGGGIAQWTLKRNYFIVSNQRIFVRDQPTPFAYKAQVIEIENVEDVSYNRSGVLQMLFGYGTIRASTVGEEHTYSFKYAKNPAAQTKIVSRVVQDVDRVSTTSYKKNRK